VIGWSKDIWFTKIRDLVEQIFFGFCLSYQISKFYENASTLFTFWISEPVDDCSGEYAGSADE
jgi:hypothetical protein